MNFPSPGNFKFVCLVHADMTGVVHVVGASTPLPHDQNFYAQQAPGHAKALAGRRHPPWVVGNPSDSQAGNASAPVSGEIVNMTGWGRRPHR